MEPSFETIIEPISVAELFDQIHAVEEKIRSAKDRFAERKRIARAANEAVDLSEYESEISNIIYFFIKDLLKREGGFKDIFQTKLGSYYMCLHTGETFRVKGGFLEDSIQPILEKIIFIDDQSNEALSRSFAEKGFKKGLLNVSLKKIPLSEGAWPIEVNRVGAPSKLTFEETEEEIIFTGSTEGGEGVATFNEGYHRGHKVDKVCTYDYLRKIFSR